MVQINILADDIAKKDDQERNKMNKKQSGSIHVVIISILAVALLGAIGFIFWQNFMMNESNRDDNTTKVATGDTVDEEAEQTSSKNPETTAESWVRFEADSYSFAVPDGWDLTYNTKSDFLYYDEKESDSITYMAGQSAVIDKVSVSGGGLTYPNSFIVKPQLVAPDTFVDSTTFKSEYGVTVQKVVEDGNSFGTEYKAYYYQFAIPGQTYPMQVGYTVEKGGDDYSLQLERGLKLLKLEK